MTKIAVISDSHGASARVEQFARLARSEGFDAVIHCGDGAGDAAWLAKTLPMPVHGVAGNCDWMCDLKHELRMTFDSARLFVTHGDMYDVKYDLTDLSYHAEEIGARAVLFGHTHRGFAGYVGPVLMVNPGALRDGRYAVLHIEGERVNPFLKAL